jgi:RNA polymerase sigma factor (sigma-70 family)
MSRWRCIALSSGASLVREWTVRTKCQGMGLALSIARTGAEAHGGRIGAENVLDAGAAFQVELPVSDDCSTAPNSTRMTTEPLVHVVDDDESLRTALLRLLDAAGFKARGYSSTGDFLINASSGGPGCLLLDVRLPGPSGLELQAGLRQQGIELPIIFLTGYADVPSSVRAMKGGAVDFLTKPVEADILLEAVRNALSLDALARAAHEKEDRLRELFASLTPREREVFNLIVAGKLNKEIGGLLGVAERTVKAQRAHIMEKLRASSAAELGRLAEQLHQGSKD